VKGGAPVGMVDSSPSAAESNSGDASPVSTLFITTGKLGEPLQASCQGSYTPGR